MSPKYISVTYDGIKYGIMEVTYKGVIIPTLMDYNDMKTIQSFNKNWICHSTGFISCTHKFPSSVGTESREKEVYLHEVIMGIKNKEENTLPQNIPVIHINKLGLDNRRINLMYDITNKDINKNIKKKARTITLPPETGIKPEEIPTYVWYLKPDTTHGERFIVEIGDISWKTTSSRKVSLRYKLEEAKAFLRNLRDSRPDLFKDFSMNGEYNEMGKNLLDSFYKIIYKLGYTYIKQLNVYNLTDNYLKQGKLDDLTERNLLKLQSFDLVNIQKNGGARRKPPKILPKTLQKIKLPQYCSYHHETTSHGDYFKIKGHPFQVGEWKTTTSKRISTKKKLDETLKYMATLDKSNE